MFKNIKVNLGNILNYILIILLFFLSIKKSGFYKTDILIFNLLLEIIGIAVITYNYIKNRSNGKVDIVGLVLLTLSVSYLFPIIFKNYASLSDSIVEFIRYFNIYITYKLIIVLPNKNNFKYFLIYLGVYLGIVGIDGIGDRILENILKEVNSGYANIHLTRMSSVVQYANVLAIILLISSVYSFEELIDGLKECSRKKITLNYTLLFFVLFCLVLTQSRVVMLLTVMYYVLYTILNKENRKKGIYIILTLVIQLVIFSNFAVSNMYINTTYIYYLSIIAVIVSIAIGFGLYYVTKNLSNKYISKLYKNSNVIMYVICGLGIIYITLAFFVTSSLKISANSKDTVKRYVYNVGKNISNTIELNINELVADSRYRLNIFEITEKNERNLLQKFEYYETSTGSFVYEFLPSDELKCIEIEFDIYKGKIEVINARLNESIVNLNYILLPSDLIYKIKDVIYGADSLNTRIIYAKDAFKIWNLSMKNRIFGVGGEGFKNLYQLVQTTNYTSTEVHNSYIQILVESGIFGFLALLTLICYYIIKYKNDIFKYSMLLLLIHSIFDLDFSYMLILQIFAIILAISNKKEEIKVYKNYLMPHIEYIIFGSLWCVSFVFSLKMNLAYSLKIPVYEENVSLENQLEVVTLMEKRVMLDSSENKYRKALANEYTSYLKLLNEQIRNSKANESKEIFIEEAENIVLNIEKNAQIMQANNSYDKNNIIDTSNIYFNNIYYLANYNYSENISKGYENYIIIIKNNLEFIENNYKYNVTAKELLNEVYIKYSNEIRNNSINAKEMLEFLEYLEEKTF